MSKEFRLESFNNLQDASMWLEQTLYEFEVEFDDIKGEIILIDGRWRCSVMVDTQQLEFNV